MNMRRMQQLYCALALGAAGLAGAPAALAAGAAASGSIQSQYELDVQRCNTGQTHQDRATCLREAGAAREEAARNRLDNNQSANFDANATARCNNLPATQREDCLRQMASPSSVRGSVESGGVLRETVIQVPAQPSGASTPGVVTPGVGTPGVGTPGVVTPGAGIPGTTTPAPATPLPPATAPGAPMPAPVSPGAAPGTVAPPPAPVTPVPAR